MEYRLKENPNGMVTKDIFIEKLRELNLMFPNWKMDLSNNDTMKLLYKYLGYCQDQAFENGVDKYINNESINPTVAGLKKYITSVDERECTKVKMWLFDSTPTNDPLVRNIKNTENVIASVFKTFIVIDDKVCDQQHSLDHGINRKDLKPLKDYLDNLEPLPKKLQSSTRGELKNETIMFY